jgi:UDP-N-acetylglucosamine 2-epimerase (non-hydrolysing)
VAGTRSFDPKEPKEINRLVIDALSDYLFTASGHSNTVAAREQQTETSQTYMVGNILMDTLRYSLPRLRKPDIRLTEGDYLLLTLNRRLLLADENRLQPLLHELAATDCHIIAPLRGNAAEIVKRLCPKNQNLSIIDALPYLEFTWLTAHAKGIVTDSGNIAEEATFLGIPCITLNEHAEHQETVTTGTNELVGTDSARLRQALTTLMSGKWKKGNLPDRWDGRTAERMVKILISS